MSYGILFAVGCQFLLTSNKELQAYRYLNYLDILTHSSQWIYSIHEICDQNPDVILLSVVT